MSLCQVTVLERTREVGKKILISGGARWYALPIALSWSSAAAAALLHAISIPVLAHQMHMWPQTSSYKASTAVSCLCSNVLPMEVDIQRDFFTESSPSALRAVFSSWSLEGCKQWCAGHVNCPLQ